MQKKNTKTDFFKHHKALKFS